MGILQRHPEYAIWAGIKSRCLRPRTTGYEHYGGRGIAVCERWRLSFEAFLADMGPRPSRKHSIERKDNNGDYEPSNCCWATKDEQASNTRGCVMVSYLGETLTQAAWARRMGITSSSMANRLDSLPLEIAMTKGPIPRHIWDANRRRQPLVRPYYQLLEARAARARSDSRREAL